MSRSTRIVKHPQLPKRHLDVHNVYMASFTVAEARNKLPELIKLAEDGKRVTITKRGIPVVEIIRKQAKPRKRVFGVLGDKNVELDPNWDRPQNDFDAWQAGDV